MSKKRSKLKTFIVATLGCAAGFFTANLVGSVVLSKKANEKMKAKPESDNMMYSVALSGIDVNIKPDTDYAFLNCLTGCMNVTLAELPTKYDLYIEFTSVMAAININLPEDVKVSVEGEGKLNAINNSVPKSDDALPTVHINVSGAKLSAINIQLGQ